MVTDKEQRHWVIVPAAGEGLRLGAGIPKQYLALGDKAVLVHTLERLGTHPAIRGIVLVLAKNDRHWAGLNWALPVGSAAVKSTSKPPVELVVAEGGASRAASVLNGLRALRQREEGDQWVLIHDAARPCLHPDDITGLLAMLPELTGKGLHGAILGSPLADTLKRVNEEHEITATIDRQGLFRALTPQLYQREFLILALEKCLSCGYLPTDEAAAVEYLGGRTRLIRGRDDNIKITHPADLLLARQILHQQALDGVR